MSPPLGPRSTESPITLLPGTLYLPEDPAELPRLVGSRCRRCSVVVFPRRGVCPVCVEEGTMEDTLLSRRGRLYSFTVAYTAPPGFEAPYLQAFVDLPEGPRIFTLISREVPPREDALREAMEMELVVEPVGLDAAGREVVTYKFRPVALEGGKA